MPAASASSSRRTRALLFDPPTDRDEALRRCAPAPEDLALAPAPPLAQPPRLRRAACPRARPRRNAERLRLGRPLRLEESLPDAVVEAVADLAQIALRFRWLGVEPAVFELYARHDGTRREHAGEIAALLDLRPMRQADYRASIRVAAACAAGTDRGEPIARAVMADLKERRITMPPPAWLSASRWLAARWPGGSRTATSRKRFAFAAASATSTASRGPRWKRC